MVSESDTIATECAPRFYGTKLRYDKASGLLRARQDLVPGEIIGRVHFSVHQMVSAGDAVTVTMKIGHVTISRSATALQAAQTGEKFFARLDDGSVIVAPAGIAEAIR